MILDSIFILITPKSWIVLIDFLDLVEDTKTEALIRNYNFIAFETFTNVFKYHVSSSDVKISVRIGIETTLIFRLHSRPIQFL